MYCGCYAMSFVLFALQFVFRYVSTCKPQYIDLFQGSRFFFWILGALSISLSWEAAAFFLFPQSPRTQETFLHFINTSYNLDPAYTDYVPYRYVSHETVSLDYVVMHFQFEIDNGVRKVITLNIIGIIQHIIVMTVSFGTLFFCACTTYSTIIKHRGMSAKTRELQMQLFRAMVVQVIAWASSFILLNPIFQATIPMIFMYCPLLFLYLCPLLNLQLGALANYQTIMGQLYPGVDPFAVLFLVSTYRRTLISEIDDVITIKTYRIQVGSASKRHPAVPQLTRTLNETTLPGEPLGR